MTKMLTKMLVAVAPVVLSPVIVRTGTLFVRPNPTRSGLATDPNGFDSRSFSLAKGTVELRIMVLA